MPEERTELRVLNPRGKTEENPLMPVSPRLKDLKGKKIGIIRIRIQAGEVLFPYLEKTLKELAPSTKWDVLEMLFIEDPEERAAWFKKMVDPYDGIVISLAISGGSTTRITPLAVEIEKLGKPVALIVTNCFQTTARYFAQNQGLEDIAIAPFAMDYVPPAEEIEKLDLAEDVAEKVILALTEWSPGSPVLEEVSDKVFTYSGASYQEAYENMEKSFLQHGWSDGFPLVPPTEEAVKRMLEGTELPAEHLIAVFPPGQGKATVGKIAVNAVMAGCLPQYMPVILAAVDAIIDPAFDLVGVQSTSGQLAPLLIVSGRKLIEELNINDSFCTLGPGWRANTAIGRALKLIMMNIGHTWPGINDMKAFGNPFRYVTLIGENEAVYSGTWEPLRVTEGFSKDQPTLSVMPAMSWQPDLVLPTPPSVKRIIEHITLQAKVKYDRYANNCYYNNLILISPTAFDAIRREGVSQTDLKQTLYERIQLPGSEVFDGRERIGLIKFPQWVIDKHNADPDAPVSILRSPESLKICVTGGPGPDMIAYIGTWGYGPSQFITRPVKLPANWDELLSKNKGWESPTVR
ncbi:hypothetical protein ACFL6W_09590 [Thermodesulfobacteriota bacterium]